MKKLIFKVHRKLAIFLAIPVILWALSGVLHPIMANWLRPDITNKFLPPTPIKQTNNILPPSEVFKDLPELHQIHLIYLDGQPAYCAITPNQKLYFRNALNSNAIKNAEQRYAEELARQYLDDQESKLVSITKVTEFGANYSYINRLLPAYRVQLDRVDGTEVVIDIRTGKLATFDSPSKRIFSKLFSWCHTWSFLGSRDSLLRIIIVLITATLTLFVGLTGIANLILFRIKRKGKPPRKISTTRKIHRYLGIFSSLFFLMFTTSAIYHVAAKINHEDSTQWRSTQKIKTSKLTSAPTESISSIKQPVSAISLAIIDSQPYYRLSIMHREQRGLSTYYHASTHQTLENGEHIYAKKLATEFSKLPPTAISKTEIITSFRQDYGFIFKRLPVTRVHYEDQSYWSYTVDTQNAHLAQRANLGGLIEALSFINLHKWHFLDPISKDLRDYATAFAAISIAILSSLGLLLLRKRT